MATVTLDGVGKSYGAVHVMESVDLGIDHGEFLVLVGPSGCGKSTLLRMIAGLEENTSGHILIDGVVVDGLEPKARDIAMVFQNYALYPHKTVEKNLSFSLSLARVPKKEIDEKVARAAEILGLGDLMRRYPAQLSGGQRQRVAMGRAIVRDPKVFLFDEPLSNLDAKLRVQMRSEIKSLHHQLGATIVYVTHDQVEAMTMADRIVVMNKGHVEQVGTPLDLYDKPQNIFVASFIGAPSMNLFKGQLEGAAESLSLRTTTGEVIALGQAVVPQGALDREIVLGVRPEHVHVARSDAPARINAVVRTVEPTGTETLVGLETGKSAFSATFRERVNPEWGKTFAVCLDAQHLHIFHARSGERIE